MLKHEKMVLGSLEENQIDLLGGSKHLSDTLREAQKLGTFTAPELAERLKVKLPALHQRMNQLAEAGLLKREDDPTATRGKRGRYSATPAEELDQADGETAEISILAGAPWLTAPSTHRLRSAFGRPHLVRADRRAGGGP